MAEVKFKRTTNVNNIPVEDGAFIVDYQQQKAYVDVQNNRIPFAGETKVNTAYKESNDETYSTNYINDKFNENKITNLYTATGDVSYGTITLSDSIQNYDFILIGIQATTYSKNNMLIPVSDIVTSSGNTDAYEISIFQSTNVYVSMQLKFLDNVSLDIVAIHKSSWENAFLRYVKGIKL